MWTMFLLQDQCDEAEMWTDDVSAIWTSSLQSHIPLLTPHWAGDLNETRPNETQREFPKFTMTICCCGAKLTFTELSTFQCVLQYFHTSTTPFPLGFSPYVISLIAKELKQATS